MSKLLRKNRGKTQNLFLIEIKVNNEEYKKEFIIMGSTGNIYNVIIKEKPTCTCPDYKTRNKRCKHIYFVLIRVMKIKNEDCNIYSEKEIKKMFENIPKITENLIVNNKIKETYEKIKNKLDNKNEIIKKDINDLCPICLDDLENGEELDYCKFSCGKSIHKNCYFMWCKTKQDTCVYCRAKWSKNEINGVYINVKNI